ncbi:MAG TPA: hypothetical protein VGR92_15680 [Steroidobacteraceae bacterium]|nr:hypothetical protein [Steroidobacteraceae bacterium]
MLYLTFAVSPALTALPAGAAVGPPACVANSQGSGLGFWLGHWNISDAELPSRATSVVSLELGQCLVVENWSDAAGHRGENLFGYNLDSRTWNGMFADNEGRIHLFDHGTVAAGKAEFYGRSLGPDGKTVLNRVAIVRKSPDDVEQTWQKSADNGATWTTAFRGKYSRSGARAEM